MTGFAENLGCHHQVLAGHLQVLQRLAGDHVRRSVGVDVGGVDEVDAGVERRTDQSFGIGLLQRTDLPPDPAAAAESHGAEAKFGNEEAGAAELVVAHDSALLCRTSRAAEAGAKYED